MTEVICTTALCGEPAVRLISCEQEGSYPYCHQCSESLLGGELDHGPLGDLIEEKMDYTPIGAELRTKHERLRAAAQRVISAYMAGGISPQLINELENAAGLSQQGAD